MPRNTDVPQSAAVFHWSAGPDSPDYHLLRIDPWRVQVLRGPDLSSRIWTVGSPPNP
ncbi:hypothetical protein [Streptomyces sp. NPDC092370]|uniref:hypothetical protein n=1 Tax=Streptomyces sp. NPDC092370 TaxID=3366016 RepID=UPI0038222DFA